MTGRIPRAEFQSLEGEMKISDHGGQVTFEMQGDCWYSSMTLNAGDALKISDWLSLYHLAGT